MDLGRLREAAAKELTTGSGGRVERANGTYQHRWQSTVQGFAQRADPAPTCSSGDYEYLEPYYDRVLGLQAAGDAVDYGTATANKLTYQGAVRQAERRDAADGHVVRRDAASPSRPRATPTSSTGASRPIAAGRRRRPPALDKTPVTFGDPTGLGINAAIDEAKVTAAKEFLAFAAGEKGAKALAGHRHHAGHC